MFCFLLFVIIFLQLNYLLMKELFMKNEMEQNIIDLKRRSMLKNSIFGLTAVVAASIIAPNAVYAADDLPVLTEADPMAMGLGYKLDATTVDKAKQAKYEAGQSCGSCALFTATKDGAGTCTIFTGKLVNDKAWCSAYAKKA